MGVAGRDETNLCVVGENGVMVDLELWGPPFFVVISCVGICIGRLRVCFSRLEFGISLLPVCFSRFEAIIGRLD
jgi:hypothetical protein